MKAVALALALSWPLALPGPLDSGREWPRFQDARVSYTLRFPPGWHATVHYRATIVTSEPVANRYDNPERVRLRRGGVYLWIFDYGRIEGAVPARPEGFDLGKKAVHSCGFGEGYSLHFRSRGRLLHAFVKLGPWTGKRDVLGVLNSLRVTE